MKTITLALAASLAACAPLTPYRYTGMTPSAHPIAWDGYPSHAGEVHVEGSFQHTVVFENLFPEVHDTALEVAATSVEARASITPVRGLDIGVHAAFADEKWTSPTAVGTLPLSQHGTLFGIGPEVRASLFLDHRRRAALGIAASAMVYQIPWTGYERSGACSQFGDGNDCYAAVNSGTDSDWVLQAGIYPSYSFGPDGKYGTAFGLVGIHTSFKNDGFATTQSNGSTIQEDGFVPYAGAGYGIHAEYIHANVMAFFPITIDTTSYGPGMMFTLGVDLPLWHPRGAR